MAIIATISSIGTAIAVVLFAVFMVKELFK